MQAGLPPSIRLSSPPCWSSPNIRYPPQHIGCIDIVTDPVALASAIRNLNHSALGNILENSSRKGGQCLFTSLPAPVTSPLRQLKCIEHDVIASKSACREDYLYQCFSIVSMYLYQVFTMTSSIIIFVIHWGITAPRHL